MKSIHFMKSDDTRKEIKSCVQGNKKQNVLEELLENLEMWSSSGQGVINVMVST